MTTVLGAADVSTFGVLVDVARERARQEQMKADGRFEYTCADKEMSDPERFAVLGEEVGEVAREVLTQPEQGLAHDTFGTRDGLRTELIQVAAVAVAWAEALDGGTSSACGEPTVQAGTDGFCTREPGHSGYHVSVSR